MVATLLWLAILPLVGPKYMKISDLAVRGGGSGSASSSNQVSNLKDALKFDERVQLVDRDDNEPLAHVPYYLKNSKTGAVVSFPGTTDENGYTERFFIQQKLKDIDIYIGRSRVTQGTCKTNTKQESVHRQPVSLKRIFNLYLLSQAF
jgi:hypothetical protein